MKLSDLKTNDELIADELRADPEFRAEWERTALARAVAVAVVRYRSERGLSQRGLAEVLDMEQPQVARLERGDVNPTMETLMRVVYGLSIELTIDVRPPRSKSRLLTAKAQKASVVGELHTDRADVLVAVA